MDRLFVDSLFRSVFHRPPRDSELNHWTSALAKGVDPRELPAKFMATKEFQRLSVRASRHFVDPGHFYSPIVDVETVRARFEESLVETTLGGIRLDADAMRKCWFELLPFMQDTPFPEESEPSCRYFFKNPAFGYGDAIVLHAMLRRYKPRKLVEVGSGYSSALSIETIDRYLNGQVAISFVEPHPELLLKLLGEARAAQCAIYTSGVQEADLEVFEQLRDGDFLFIDSTHVLKTGSDVCHELFNILPALKPGVFVHFHDIFWPFEYPKKWAIDENRSWNEIYALRAFLMYNHVFEIVFFNDWFARYERDLITVGCPAMLRNTGGSIWIRKTV